jgi:hypothetical protein
MEKEQTEPTAKKRDREKGIEKDGEREICVNFL